MRLACTLFFTTFLIIGTAISSVLGEEENVIDWKIFHIQAIYNKPGTGEGFADELFRYYREQLPEYSHRSGAMPIKRIFHEMSNLTTGIYCCPGKTPLSHELMDKVIFSRSAMELAPPGIVVRNTDIGTLFQPQTVVSIAELLEKQRLRTSWVRGATYHPAIREVIERNEQLPNVTMQSSVIGEFQQMLLRGRIDFYVSHALDFAWHRKNTPMARENFSFLRVKEAPTPVSLLVFCNDTKESKEVIEKINKILQSDDFIALREDIIRRYYPDDLVEQYIHLHRAMVSESRKD